MKERPILFSAPMVRALLDGSKTQTRRVVRKQFAADAIPVEVSATTPEGWQTSGHSGLWWDDGGACLDDAIHCPYGIPGDRLWVREAFRTEEGHDSIKPSLLPVAASGKTLSVPFWYDANLPSQDFTHALPGLRPGKYRPGMFMPRAASRITLEVTGVRIERLNDISEADANAEGVRHSLHLPGGRFARGNYEHLWWTINGDGSWEANPWVWVVEFKVAKP